jgi:hypothetical protein
MMKKHFGFIKKAVYLGDGAAQLERLRRLINDGDIEASLYTDTESQ